MKRNCVRAVYGAGLLVAAVGFILPLVDAGFLLGGTYTGFQLASLIGNFKETAEICLYAMFGFMCLGGVAAFIPSLRTADYVSFGGIVASVVVLVCQFVTFGAPAKKATVFSDISSKMLSGLLDMFKEPLTKLILEVVQVGLWMFVIGLVVAVISFILSFCAKK